MKISILLPYKENYSPNYPGAVSIFVNSTNNVSKYKKNLTVFGSTNHKKKLAKNYVNIHLSKKILRSQSKEYVDKFLEIQKKDKPDIIDEATPSRLQRWAKGWNSGRYSVPGQGFHQADVHPYLAKHFSLLQLNQKTYIQLNLHHQAHMHIGLVFQ